MNGMKHLGGESRKRVDFRYQVSEGEPIAKGMTISGGIETDG